MKAFLVLTKLKILRPKVMEYPPWFLNKYLQDILQKNIWDTSRQHLQGSILKNHETHMCVRRCKQILVETASIVKVDYNKIGIALHLQTK